MIRLAARRWPGRPVRCALAAAASAAVLAACVSTQLHEAPIVERSAVPQPEAAAAQAPAPPTPAREAHDGQYVVQAGDTLYSVALAFGQDFRDIARWNGLDESARLQPGQSLRVAPPAADEGASSAAEATPIPVSPESSVETRPLSSDAGMVAAPSAPPAATPTPPAAPSAPLAAAPAAPPAAGVPSATQGKTSPVEPEGVWAWPSAGKVLERFDDTHNKGIDIAGSVGDPVWAANDGQVVYSGNGLRGYGKLVIIKHTDDYVSAYAHNNEILVTQGQVVKRGQRIADLGMTDAASPRLRFEIRRRGTPVDPLTYLPSR